VRVMEGREGACELSGSHGKSHKVINGVSEVAACTTTCMTWNMTWNLTWYMYTTLQLDLHNVATRGESWR
jgi:hypothetical protein